MRKTFGALFTLFVLSLSGANAADTVWNTPVTISGDSDVSTAGTLVWAYRFTGDDTSDMSNYGVNFVGAPYNADLMENIQLSPGGLSGQNDAFSGGGGFGPVWTLGSSTQGILRNGLSWAMNPGFPMAGMFTLTNLQVGMQYQLQIWVNDSRADSDGVILGRHTVFSDIFGVSSAPVAHNDGVTETGGSVGQYVIGTFTATNDFETFNVSAGPGGNGLAAQINAMQLREMPPVPEPTTWALMTVALLGFALLRRQTRRA